LIEAIEREQILRRRAGVCAPGEGGERTTRSERVPVALPLEYVLKNLTDFEQLGDCLALARAQVRKVRRQAHGLRLGDDRPALLRRPVTCGQSASGCGYARRTLRDNRRRSTHARGHYEN
jgi:hypothetical protein